MLVTHEWDSEIICSLKWVLLMKTVPGYDNMLWKVTFLVNVFFLIDRLNFKPWVLHTFKRNSCIIFARWSDVSFFSLACCIWLPSFFINSFLLMAVCLRERVEVWTWCLMLTHNKFLLNNDSPYVITNWYA